MRKVKEILRLTYENGLSRRQVAQSVALARATITDYLRRFEASGLTWPAAAALDAATLERRLFPSACPDPVPQRPEPDWATVHRELRRKGVTLMLLWQEYKARDPEGYQYSWFCDAYRAWAGRRDLVMRQTHRAGETLFVDYAGQTVPVIDRTTGEVRQAQIFVAVLGASNYTYAEASWSQGLLDWIQAHVRAFAFLGGVPECLVPDNLKAGVTQPHRYEPDLNPTYQELAAHYGTAILPARVRRPKDKAKVEAGVLLVERWILAALRHQTFFSLSELNRAIRTLLTRLNARPFRKLPGSRQALFETLDRPALRPLPDAPYVYAEWRKARVHIDYHVEVDRHYYSVPYQLVKHAIEIRLTAHTVECFFQGNRVASHARAHLPGRHTTLPEHMPTAHRQYAEWTPERLVRWAEKSGPATAALIQRLLERRTHPQQGFRSALGIMRLGKSYGADRLEAACARALELGALSYRSLESILRQGLDRTPVTTPEEAPATPAEHEHLRGARYYH